MGDGEECYDVKGMMQLYLVQDVFETVKLCQRHRENAMLLEYRCMQGKRKK